MRSSMFNNLLAVCSKDAVLQVVDLNKGKEAWKARNLPNDEYDL